MSDQRSEQQAEQPVSWEVLNQKPVLQHPFLTVAMESVRLPDGEVIVDWPKVYTKDYVNALVLNEAEEALIIEGYKHGTGWSSWQMLGGYMEDDEDPLTAVQRELLEETGYQSDLWTYLGSFVVDPNRHVGVGHFFCAQRAHQVAEPNHEDLEAFVARWVALQDLRYALLDGRIAAIGHAMNVSLALLTVLNKS